MSRSARVEVAKSGRSTCVHCGKLIAQGEHRLLIDKPGFGDTRPDFFHLACGVETSPKLAKAALAAAGLPLPKKEVPSARAELPPEVKEALATRPHDDATLRVYADWLEGQGQTLGRYISATLDARTKDAAKLMKTHRAEWLGGVTPTAFTWDRGLVQTATLNARSPAELARLVGEVLTLPAFACLEVLELPGPIDAEVYAAISRAAPRSLRELSLLLRDGIDRLELPSLTRLTVLCEQTRAPLALSPKQLPALTALHVARHWNARELDEAQLIALRDLPLLPQLTELTVVRGLIDPELARAFTKGDGLFARAIALTLGSVDSIVAT